MVYFKPRRLLFDEPGAVPGYCLPARTCAAAIGKVLCLPPGHYIDDYIAALLAADTTAVDDLCFKLQRAKLKFGTSLLYPGMELRFLHDGILFVISENRRKKYMELLQRNLDRGVLLGPRASQLAGRLN